MQKSLVLRSLFSFFVSTVGVLSVSTAAFAASANFQDPEGWDRGDLGTAYVHWEEFDSAGMFADGTFVDDISPDAGFYVEGHTLGPGGYSTSINTRLLAYPESTNDNTEIIIEDGNIISRTGVVDFLTQFRPLNDITTGFDGITVALQTASQGVDLNLSTIRLQDATSDPEFNQTPDSIITLFDTDERKEYLFLWTLSSNIVDYYFSFESESGEFILDAVAVDIGPVAAVVPVPAAFSLLGSALLGLLGIRWRRS